MKALLIPKVRSYFAEFLNINSLKRLNKIYQSTWVGLEYGFFVCFSSWTYCFHLITWICQTKTYIFLILVVRFIKLKIIVKYTFTLNTKQPISENLSASRLGAGFNCAIKWNAEHLGFSALVIFHTSIVTHTGIFTSDRSIFFYKKTSHPYRTFRYLPLS